MTEHTPSKWTAVFEEFDHGGKTIPIVDALGMWICGVLVGMRDRKQAKANARLIAAAPALLNALIRYRAHHDQLQWPQYRPCQCEICQQADEAIASAKGV